MERLFVDSVGPLVQTKRGNIAILVILDALSKFVSFCTVRRISSQVVVECLERAFFPAYGTPNSIVTDKARVFCGRHFRDLCFGWGIDHITTTPYYPHASLAEHATCNLKSVLKIFHHESQEMWDVYLPRLSMVFNTATHESTKCMPDKLFFGREMKSPLDVSWDLSPENVDGGEDTNQFWTDAYRNLQLARKRVARRYNRNHKPH
jgi:transposase InsO family protein